MTEKLQLNGLESCVGLLLAGGNSRRFGGGDKCLHPLDGQTLLSHVITRAAPQVKSLILNASGNATRFASYGLAVVADDLTGHLGPLAGILTGLDWTKENRPNTKWVASFATDAPFFPLDLVNRLHGAAHQHGTKIAIAKCQGQTQPVFALWSVDLAPDLRVALVEQGVRKVMAWVERHDPVFVEFSRPSFDPFFNINTQEDLNKAESLIQQGSFHDGQ
ncbi:MAG: molybdenum cofactor guanylyltransferase MobA [Magnetovibrio sp.]|nr:molybdenum cofactor guanylyltransferase MobA [Magnetovibrio sp.]